MYRSNYEERYGRVPEFVLDQKVSFNYLQTDDNGKIQLKGKQQEITLHAVYLSASKEAKNKKRNRCFFNKRKNQIV